MALKRSPTNRGEFKEVPLSPSQEHVTIKGKLAYNENARAWTTLRLKKEVLYEFPELKDKQLSFGYTMVIPRSIEAMRKHFKEFEKTNSKIPIFILFNKISKDIIP